MKNATTSGNRNGVRIPVVLFAGFACLYSGLRSKDILAVDGAHRCLGVWRRQSLFFHTNNHMLYPVDVLLWTRLAAALGNRPNGPLQFFSTVELMNCVAGAACMAILGCLIYWTTRSWGLAVGAAIACGFAKAYLEQATNANEPLVGVLWSLVALLFSVLAYKAKWIWPAVVSGIVFSLAMATYQSTIFLAPAAIILLWRASPETQTRTPRASGGLFRVASFVFGGLAAGVAIYGWAYRRMGLANPSAMLRHFFVLEGGEGFVAWGFGHFPNLFVGLIRNIFPIQQSYSGIHNLLAGPKFSLAVFSLLILSLCAFLGYCFALVWARRAALTYLVRTALLSASVGLVFTVIPLLITNPGYDKLWLQPLACITFLLALALYVVRDQTPQVWRYIKFGAAIFLTGVMSNCVWAARGHEGETLGMQAAQEVAGRIAQQDLVVGGWDNVSTLYGDIWAARGQFMDLSSEAQYHGRGATELLRAAVLKTQVNGGHVYFLGMLETPKPIWDSYLGSVCGLPFSDLDFYRTHSSVVATFQIGSSGEALWQLDSASHP